MIKDLLALIGVLFILAGTFLGLASSTANPLGPPAVYIEGIEETAVWQSVQSATGITLEQFFVLSMVGFLLGVILIIPWGRERLQREGLWWEKRDGPLDTPPPAGM